MSVMTQFEDEEECICDAMNNGEISQEQGRRELRELRRNYTDEAEESAQDAYDGEMDQW